MLRLVLGHHLRPLPGVGADDVWRPPGVEDVEVLLGPRVPPGEEYDPSRHTVAATLAAAGWERADCYLHWLPEYRALPLDAFSAAGACVLAVGDWNLAGRVLRLLAPHVDGAVCDPPGVARLRRLGYPRVAPAFLWGWDPTSWSPGNPRGARDIDVLFVGSRNAAVHGRRERWLARLARLADRHDVRIVTAHGAEYLRLSGRAKIVFNHSVRGEANMRAHEAAVAGACVLNERGNESLAHDFRPNVDYATYGDDLEEVVEALLADDERRVAIAAAGQRAALPWTYEARLAQTVTAVRSLLADGRERVAPAGADVLAEQWRLVPDRGGWRAGGRVLAAAGARPVEVVRHEALASLCDADDATTALAATAALGADPGAVDDAALLLARAEAALRAGEIHAAVAAALAAHAAPRLAHARVAAPDWNEWWAWLETATVDAEDAVAAADRFVRLRAGYVVAAAARDSLDDGALAALLGGDDLPAPALFLRALVRERLGQLDAAAADLSHLVWQRPFDEGGREAHARVVSLLARRATAA